MMLGIRALMAAAGAGGTPPVADWWDVPGKTCVAVYQPKGAASLAASYSNLANPGTYDATVLTSAPSFNTSTGWTFNNSAALNTGIVPLTGWSMLVRVAEANKDTDETPVGSLNIYATQRFHLTTRAGSDHAYGIGGNYAISGAVASGVMAIAGNSGYLDGSLETASGGYTGNDVAIVIGGVLVGTSLYAVYSGQIVALAIYSDTLTGGEVATVSSAMAAL